MRNEYRRRNSLRYPGYDYSQAGAVFVTFRTKGYQRLFGVVGDGAVELSPPGGQVRCRWLQIPDRFPGVMIDAFVIMPDHVHGIVMTGTDPGLPARTTTGEVVHWVKSSMFTDYTIGLRDHSWEPYDRKPWQDNYYDHIVRNERDLDRIRAYIEGNPARWDERERREAGDAPLS
jgi:REP element-mobilizing transposase RayT